MEVEVEKPVEKIVEVPVKEKEFLYVPILTNDPEKMMEGLEKITKEAFERIKWAMMAKSRASKEQYSKITHNTLAFEEAIMASVRTAALPAQQALAQARYDQAKAFLLKVVAYFIAALGIFIVLWLFLELAKYAYGGWTKRTVPTPTVIQTENIIKDETVSTEKEIELRSIVNRTIEENSRPIAKVIDPLQRI